MRMCPIRWIAAVALAVVLATSAPATTWSPQEFVCPLCKTTNTFQVIMSYGSYIYHWPSKYQYVYWPHTDTNVLYSCKKCHLTAFMGEFEAIQVERLPAVQEALAKVSAPPWPGEYTKIPMTERLTIAEQVYSALERDDEWWCHFYRVVGYHAAKEDKSAEAAAARAKALALAEKLAADTSLASRRKEFLYVVGAMRFFGSGDEDGALRAYEEAQRLTWVNSSLPNERSEGFDGYLSELIKQSIEGIADVRRERTEPVVPHKILAPRLGWVWDLAVSPDGSVVASSHDETIVVWDMRSATKVREIDAGNTILTLAFSPDGTMLAASGYSAAVDLYDVPTGRRLRSLTRHKDHVAAVEFSPDGSLLVSGSWDDTIRLWDPKTGQAVRTIKHATTIWDISISPDGQRIAAVDDDNKVLMWDVRNGSKLPITFAGNAMRSIAFSPDGGLVAGGGEGGAVIVWNARTGERTKTLRGHAEGITALAFGPGGLLATVAWDGTVRLWDVSAEREIRTLTRRGGQLSAVAFSPDQQTIVSGSRDGTVRLWDATKEPAPPAGGEIR